MFVTNSFVYYEDGRKEKTKVEIDGIEVSNFWFNTMFDVDFLKSEFRKKHKDAIFFDEVDFDFDYYDGDFYIHNSKKEVCRFLDLEKRKDLFSDLEPIKRVFKSDFVISFEDLSEIGIKSITPFEYFNLKPPKVKTNKGYVDIDTLNFVKHPSKITLKLKKEHTFKTGVDGVCKIEYKRGYLNIGDKKIFVLKEIL